MTELPNTVNKSRVNDSVLVLEIKQGMEHHEGEYAPKIRPWTRLPFGTKMYPKMQIVRCSKVNKTSGWPYGERSKFKGICYKS